jgi:hypothetical protein
MNRRRYTPRSSHRQSFIFSESEWEWIERRADEISLVTGDPLPFAKTAAIADLLKLRQRPKAQIIEFRKRRGPGEDALPEKQSR